MNHTSASVAIYSSHQRRRHGGAHAYVCTYVRVYVPACAWACVCACVRAYVCVRAEIRLCVCVCVVCVCVNFSTLHPWCQVLLVLLSLAALLFRSLWRLGDRRLVSLLPLDFV